jgi:Tfp pilus assembly protein PilN
MIRINLIEGAKPQLESKPGTGPSSFPVLVFGGAFLVAGLVVGACYWYLDRQLTNLGEQLDVEKQEAARLAAIQAENTRYETQLRDIDRRIAAIQTLESNRKGPTALMAALGTTVNRTAGLYLASVTPKEGRLFVNGLTNSAVTIADFMAALRAAGDFEDIQLRQYVESDREGQVSFKFDLDCVYRPHEAAAEAPRTAGARAPAASRGT